MHYLFSIEGVERKVLSPVSNTKHIYGLISAKSAPHSKTSTTSTTVLNYAVKHVKPIFAGVVKEGLQQKMNTIYQRC